MTEYSPIDESHPDNLEFRNMAQEILQEHRDLLDKTIDVVRRYDSLHVRRAAALRKIQADQNSKLHDFVDHEQTCIRQALLSQPELSTRCYTELGWDVPQLSDFSDEAAMVDYDRLNIRTIYLRSNTILHEEYNRGGDVRYPLAAYTYVATTGPNSTLFNVSKQLINRDPSQHPGVSTDEQWKRPATMGEIHALQALSIAFSNPLKDLYAHIEENGLDD